MKKSDELKELLEQKRSEASALSEKASAEKRMLTDDELDEFELLRSEISGLKKNIEAAEFTEEQQRRKAAELADQRRKKKNETPEQKFAKKFSLVRAIRMAGSNQALDGAEREAFEETKKEYRGFSQSLDGNVGVPSFVVYPDLAQKRDQNVTTPADGGYTVPQDIVGHISPLRPMPVVEQAGATVLRGLTGNVRFTKNAIVTAAWEGETDQDEALTSAFDVLDMSPKRIAATGIISKQNIMQASMDIERIVADEIRSAIERGVDLASLNGASGGLDPTGILNTTGVNAVAIGTNGGAITWAKVVEMATKVMEANGVTGQMTYVTTPGVMGMMKTTEKAANTGQFIYNDAAGDTPVNGYRNIYTNLMPSDLTKGTGTNLHAMIFGVWASLYLGNWGGLDIVVDPYSAKRTAQVEYTVNSWWDVGVRHAAQFSHIKDIDTTA